MSPLEPLNLSSYVRLFGSRPPQTPTSQSLKSITVVFQKGLDRSFETSKSASDYLSSSEGKSRNVARISIKDKWEMALNYCVPDTICVEYKDQGMDCTYIKLPGVLREDELESLKTASLREKILAVELKASEIWVKERTIYRSSFLNRSLPSDIGALIESELWAKTSHTTVN